MWVTANEIQNVGIFADYKNIRNVRDKLNQLADESQKRKRSDVKGKPPFEYHIDCLPETTRMALLQSIAKETASAEQSDTERTVSSDELWFEYDNSTDAQKERTVKAHQLCVTVRTFVKAGMSWLNAMKKVADESGVTVSRLKRYFYVKPALISNNIPERDWLAALLDKRGGNRQHAEIHPDAWALYVADYYRPEKPTHSECYRRLLLIAAQKGWDLPCIDTFKAHCARKIPYEVEKIKRDGLYAAQQSLVPAQRRTREGMHAMQRVSGDGHSFRVWCHLDDGSVIRPLVWVFQDVYSSMIVGYSIDVSENTEMLGIAVYNMISKYGIPQAFDLDNGSAALSEAMTGGMARPVIGGSNKGRKSRKFDRTEVDGLITSLGSTINWSSVVADTNGKNKGNARAKPVERLFHSKGGIGQFERHPAFDGAYTGESALSKPANVGTNTVNIDEFVALFDQWVAQWNSEKGRQTEIARGVHSYADVFSKSYENSAVAKPSDAQLAMCFLRTQKAVKVYDGGLVELNAGRYSKGKTNRYASELLYRFVGQKVNLRFNPYDLSQRVWAYEETGRLIGEIPVYGDVHYADLGAARRHSLKQSDALERAQWVASSVITKGIDEVADAHKALEHDETGLGCPAPMVTQMTPKLPRKLNDFPIEEEFKMAVGHDGPPAETFNLDDFETPEFAKALVSQPWASRKADEE